MSDHFEITTDREAQAYQRGYDIASSRAESRRRLDLTIERTDPKYPYDEPNGPNER